MRSMREIKQIHVDPVGWVSRYTTNSFTHEVLDNGKIEHFTKNGEMALVDWYRQGDREYNGKYVTTIEYYEDNKTKADNA